MKKTPLQPDATELGLLEEVVGYLNFSSGTSDPQFLRNIAVLFRAIESRPDGAVLPVAVFCAWLDQRMDELQASSSALAMSVKLEPWSGCSAISF